MMFSDVLDAEMRIESSPRAAELEQAAIFARRGVSAAAQDHGQHRLAGDSRPGTCARKDKCCARRAGTVRHCERQTRGHAYPGGPDIGTTIAISGAAVSPYTGDHTSSPMAFLLMTVFNARLGWWLGNPRSPKQASVPVPSSP